MNSISLCDKINCISSCDNLKFYLSINAHAISLNIHPVSKSCNNNYTEDKAKYMLYGGMEYPTAYVSKRKKCIAIMALITLFLISRLAVKSVRLLEVIIIL